MKKLSAFIMTVLLLVVTACGKADLPETDVSLSIGQTTSEDVQRDIGKAVDTVGDYAADKKQAYESQVQSQLNAFEKRIQELQARAEDAGEDTKAALEEQIQALQDQRNAIANQVDDLKNASGRAFDELSSGIQKSLKGLQRSYEQALNEFNQA